MSRYRLIYYTRQLWLGLQKAIDEQLRDMDMSIATASLLRLAHDHGQVSSAELARLQGVSPQAVNENVAKLVKRGLIERQESPASQRILLIRLSPSGEEMLERLERVMNGVQEQFLGHLSDEQVAAAEEVLGSILERHRPFAVGLPWIK